MKLIKKVIWILLLVFFVVLIVFSLSKIIPWIMDNIKTNEEIKELEKIVEVKEEDNNEVVIYDYDSKYLDEEFLSLDFNKLLKENPKTVGFIKVSGTKINYPFVQYSDNNYYLNHSFYNKYNGAGWLFLDYRNNIDTDQNSIIYAHGRADGTMFGSLKNTLSSKWQDNDKNHVVKVSTPSNNYVYEVFSIYHIKTTDDYLQINFNSDNSYNKFLNNIKNRSAYNFNTKISSGNRILTLSTCYNDDEKMVLHAKLIKKEIRK